MTISPSRPRVYLIDFETAIQFSDDCPPEDRVCVGLPLGGSFLEEHMYARPKAPETASGHPPYSPFKLDVWQLGASFYNYKVRIRDDSGSIVIYVAYITDWSRRCFGICGPQTNIPPAR